MAITGIDTIEGKQIIAAGAVSAKSAEMAYNDENGNPITGYQIAGDYYSASNPSGFITGVDLTPYQTTAGMTAYANSATVTGTAQYGLTTAGWSEITGGGEVPEGVLVESGLEYDNTEISGYSGSAFKDVALTDVVTANSGVWGGSALPISAGPGIKISLQNNTLVFESDETLLWSGDRSSAADLSENPTNFKKLRVEDIYHNLYEFSPSTGAVHQEIKLTNFTGQPQQLYVQFSATTDKLYITKGFQTVYLTWDAPGNATWTATNVNNTYSREIIAGVTGINRIAGE